MDENQDISTGITPEDLSNKKKETSYQVHEAASYANKIVSMDPTYDFQLKIYKGTDAADHFMTSLQVDAKKIYKQYI